jgi:hypothetical protein
MWVLRDKGEKELYYGSRTIKISLAEATRKDSRAEARK